MLTVVCWKWTPRPGYRSTFGPETVNTLAKMVKRHYPDPHRFLCVTDDPVGIDKAIDTVPVWNDFADLPSPHGGNNPSCYRRLRAFHPDIGKVFGERFVSLDLDCVITGDLRPVWNRREEFVIYGDTNPRTYYNGSMFLLTAGARPHVWTQFDPVNSPRLALRSGLFGSDQGWVSYILGPKEAKWSKRDGVYSFRNELARRPALPVDAKVAVFHGKEDPWVPTVQMKHPWIREHYC